MNRFPSKTNALNFIRQSGVEIATIIDVGVMTSTTELMLVYPDRKHLLFEPVVEFHRLIEANYAGIEHELLAFAVSDMDGVHPLQIVHAGGAEHITHSRLVTEMPGDAEIRQIKTVSLDSFLAGREEAKPYLLKIDVDGHEMPILGGARQTLRDTDCVVLEVHTGDWLERAALVEASGFFLADIVDLCYYRGALAQVDMIFLANGLKASWFAAHGQDFDWTKWKNLSHKEGSVIW